MATLITATGAQSTVSPLDASAGFSLEEVYRLLECETVQHVNLADGRLMLMDEEAKIRNGQREINLTATRLLMEAGGLPRDYIIGSVLVCSRTEFL